MQIGLQIVYQLVMVSFDPKALIIARFTGYQNLSRIEHFNKGVIFRPHFKIVQLYERLYMYIAKNWFKKFCLSND